MKTTITQESGQEYLMNELRSAETKVDFILSFWMYWAQSVTVNSREFQQVIANARVNKWFLHELQKEEAEYNALVERYNNITQTDKETLYVKCVFKLLSRFPMALLVLAKKRELKPRTTKVSGIKIEFSIINLN